MKSFLNFGDTTTTGMTDGRMDARFFFGRQIEESVCPTRMRKHSSNLAKLGFISVSKKSLVQGDGGQGARVLGQLLVLDFPYVGP